MIRFQNHHPLLSSTRTANDQIQPSVGQSQSLLRLDSLLPNGIRQALGDVLHIATIGNAGHIAQEYALILPGYGLKAEPLSTEIILNVSIQGNGIMAVYRVFHTLRVLGLDKLLDGIPARTYDVRRKADHRSDILPRRHIHPIITPRQILLQQHQPIAVRTNLLHYGISREVPDHATPLGSVDWFQQEMLARMTCKETAHSVD
ncbi:hypothetical protein CKO13_04015 [Halorhodospira neutriphila]|uniref:Uncharacterized protein n=1 Tax=Halorhodospira neutriphila TaxID=168379 RepID=A0ABS1E533_9GAMM|nr:hypothetical protein [Halorhodospira neutriphila]